MEFRGVSSDKQKLINLLEQTFLKATSQQNFYKKLHDKGLQLYKRNGKIVGVKLKRKFRFATLGYDINVLKNLDKNISKNKRIEALNRIRERQKGRSKGRE